MAKTETSRYDVAEHLRNPEEMAAYLEACMEGYVAGGTGRRLVP
jgi:DNA-binding phage protein